MLPSLVVRSLASFFVGILLLSLSTPSMAKQESAFDRFIQSVKRDPQTSNPALDNTQTFGPAGNSIQGNPNGDVTIIEFFDYRCSYCRQIPPLFDRLVKTDPNLRIVYRDYVLFGATSEFAARAALAATYQKNNLAFHNALLRTPGALTPESIMGIAKRHRLDTEKLLRDMNSAAVTTQLEQNSRLADDLHISGTPAFVFAKTSTVGQGKSPVIISIGAINLSQFRKAIAAVRQPQ